MSEWELLAHAGATLAMTGLIWTIQLVHYPLMVEVRQGFARYHELHCARIAWLVAPLMGVEALTAVLLLLERPPWVSYAEAVVGLALVALIWAATALFSVPEHARLASGHDARSLRRLVATNWIRTAAWTVRSAIVLRMLAEGLAVRPGPA